jgi:hypothetical protein
MTVEAYKPDAQLIPCMGGFCEVRMRCAHYHVVSKATPSERLCSRTWHDAWKPIRWHAPPPHFTSGPQA